MVVQRYRVGLVITAFAALQLGIAGCTSMRSVPLSTQPTPSPSLTVKAGDTVSVTMKDGRQERFVVRSVDDDALVSSNEVRYRTADIAVLKRRSFSPAKTTILAAGTFVGVVIIAIGAALGSLAGGI